jgi:hypothetical protein
MNFLPGWSRTAGGILRPSFSFQSALFDDANAGEYTAPSVDLGPATPTRLIVVGIAGITGEFETTPLSVAVGGVELSQVVFDRNVGNSRNGHVAIYKGQVPNITSGDVVATWVFASMLRHMIAVWRADRLISNDTFDTDSDDTAPVNLTVNVPPSGFVVAMGAIVNADPSWSDGVSEDAEGNEGVDFCTAGSVGLLPAETGRTISLASSTSNSSCVCCASIGGTPA